MTRGTRRLGLVAACALCLGLNACDNCGHSAQPGLVLATLVETQGDAVRRDFAKARDDWHPASPGAQFRLGDGLRADAPSSAELSLANGAQLTVQPGTLIRFELAGNKGSRIEVVSGEAVLRAGNRPLQLNTSVGSATLTAGGSLRLTRDGDAVRLHVEVGSAKLRDAHGSEIALAKGETVWLKVGMAVLREPPSQAGRAHREPATKLTLRVEKPGARVRLPGEKSFHALSAGNHVQVDGAELKLAAGATVELARGNDRTLLRGSGEYVLGGGTVWVNARRGDLELNARSGEIEVIAPGGRIIAHAADSSAAAQLRIGASDGVLEVQHGKVTWAGQDARKDLGDGDSFTWSLLPPSQADAGFTPGPQQPSFEAGAGESFVVHAPEVPVALTLDISEHCRDAGIVQLSPGGQRFRGSGHVNVWFPAGIRRYTLRCEDDGAAGKRVARGSVRVLRDSGTRRLPPRAPTSSIDADGRTYTIYYQNQLPEVRLRWPHAPKSGQYELTVDGKSVSVESPEHLFASGSLGDGTHELGYAAAGRKSRTTTVNVRFDNTAPTASLSAPKNRAFAVGETVSVEGIALPSWKVSVQGGTINLAGDGRFQGEVVTSAQRPDVAVRLAHPRLGTHYYLRRAADTQ